MQPTVAVSTAEAEVNAAVVGVQEVIHINGILEELGYKPKLPIPLYVDNQAAIALSKNPEQQSKTKHFAIRLAFLRESCQNRIVSLRYVPSEDMVADILTKCLVKTKNKKCLSLLMGPADIANSGGFEVDSHIRRSTTYLTYKTLDLMI